jgi:RHS repeat-associated protein
MRYAIFTMATLAVCASCADTGSADTGSTEPGHTRNAPSFEVRYFHGGLAPGAELSTDALGAKAWERRYEPYGAPLEGADFADEPEGGLGKPVDASTQLADHGARWSSFATARWLSPDPRVKAPAEGLARSPWELAPYAYAGGSPTLYWDPDGRDLRITGSYAKELAKYYAEASGLTLTMSKANGQVSLSNGKGGGSGVAAAVLILAVITPGIHVELETIGESPRWFFGGPRQGSQRPGHYRIDMHDVRQWAQIDDKLAKGGLCHELFESFLHGYDSRQAAHDEQHALAIGIENAVLQQLGAGYQRGASSTDYDKSEDAQLRVIDYGKFELNYMEHADGTTGDVSRKDH